MTTTVTGNIATAPSPDDNMKGEEEDNFAEAKTAIPEETEEEKAMRLRMTRGNRRRVSVSSEVMSAAAAGASFKPKVVPKTADQEKAIRDAIAKNFLFSNLTEANRKTIIDSMTEKNVPAGVSVIEEGDIQADFFYVVENGTFDVLKNGANDGAPVFNYGPGGAFGELALMYNAPRAATVKSTSDAKLWCVDRETFRHIIVASTNQVRSIRVSISFSAAALFAVWGASGAWFRMKHRRR